MEPTIRGVSSSGAAPGAITSESVLNQAAKAILIVLGVLIVLWIGFALWFSGYEF